MLTVYLSKRKLIRTAVYSALVIIGAVIGILAVLTCINISASERILPIYRVNRDDNKIALTFDVAWGNSDTKLIIDTLGKYNVKATLFFTGEWIDSYPDDVKAYFDAGHEIANHSNSHPYPTKLSINELIEDTKKCAEKIKKITANERPLYRAPYGDYNDTVISTVNGMGYEIIQWDCDSLDWKDISAEEINKRICAKVKSGSILLFHTDKGNTHQSLKTLIPLLQSQGYKFVTVSELIYHDNYDINPNGEQYSTAQ